MVWIWWSALNASQRILARKRGLENNGQRRGPPETDFYDQFKRALKERMSIVYRSRTAFQREGFHDCVGWA